MVKQSGAFLDGFKVLFCGLAVCLLLGPAPCPGQGNPFETSDERLNKLGERIWKDASGKFSVEGSAVKFADGKLTLRRKDGKEIVMLLEKLSPEDQKIITGDSATNFPIAPTDLEKPKASSADEDAQEKKVSGKKARMLKVDSSLAVPLELSPPDEWQYQPDPLPKDVRLPDQRFSLGKAVTFHDHIKQHFISATAAKGVLVVENSFEKQPNKILILDLKKHTLESQGTFVPNYMPLAATPNMKQVLGGWNEKNDRDYYQVTLFDILKNRTHSNFSWIPFPADDNSSKTFKTVNNAVFIDDTHLMTSGVSPGAVVWEVGSGVKPLYRFKSHAAEDIAFSAGRKYMAMSVMGIGAAQGVMIYETSTGKRAGFLPLDDLTQSLKLAFSDSGQKLVAVGAGRIVQWDLATQKVERQFANPSTSYGGVLWLNDDFILLGHSVIVDLNHRVVVWKYNPLDVCWQEVGKMWFIERSHDSRVFAGTSKLPKAAKELLQKVAPDSMLVLKPGSAVNLDIKMEAFPQHTEIVRERVLKQLAAKQILVDPSSPNLLTVSLKQGDSKQVAYRTHGFLAPPSTSTHNYNQYVSLVQLQINNKVVWSHESKYDAPHLLNTKDGESIDQGVQRSIEESSKTVGTVWIPNYVAVMPEGKEAGQSNSPGVEE